ncbi:protein FAM179B-like protein [Sarcoptes scabiei]|uniref:Protein FAM179B-like protein n=1 Tax=Sarcoptes scabiei TaxID=52283 RepID=A0A132A377_SARSC|nr:protein FAM179B-like protein [Sarcoptes scabiei]
MERENLLKIDQSLLSKSQEIVEKNSYGTESSIPSSIDNAKNCLGKIFNDSQIETNEFVNVVDQNFETAINYSASSQDSLQIPFEISSEEERRIGQPLQSRSSEDKNEIVILDDHHDDRLNTPRSDINHVKMIKEFEEEINDDDDDDGLDSNNNHNKEEENFSQQTPTQIGLKQNHSNRIDHNESGGQSLRKISNLITDSTNNILNNGEDSRTLPIILKRDKDLAHDTNRRHSENIEHISNGLKITKSSKKRHSVDCRWSVNNQNSDMHSIRVKLLPNQLNSPCMSNVSEEASIDEQEAFDSIQSKRNDFIEPPIISKNDPNSLVTDESGVMSINESTLLDSKHRKHSKTNGTRFVVKNSSQTLRSRRDDLVSNQTNSVKQKPSVDNRQVSFVNGGQDDRKDRNEKNPMIKTEALGTDVKTALSGKKSTEKSNRFDQINTEMDATNAPSNFDRSDLNSFALLDADSLANLDYIPPVKGHYWQCYYPYFYDNKYPHAASSSIVSNQLDYHLTRFGIFPRILIYQAISSIAEEQFAAIQAIVRIVRESPQNQLVLLLPYMDEFLSIFIAKLLWDDMSNFKVILWSLDIIELLSDRFGLQIHSNLSQLILLLSRRLGDTRIVIRDSVIKVFHQIILKFHPQECLNFLFEHISSHQHQPLAFTSVSKQREEMANRITASVTTFPRERLNLSKLCFDIAPLLVDNRAQIRLASLECVATLAQALGPHKLGSLMTAIHSLESSLMAIDFERLIGAIQARIARRSLPRVDPDGTVHHVLRVPKSSESWYYRRIYDADLEWITIGPTELNVSKLSLFSTNDPKHRSIASQNDHSSENSSTDLNLQYEKPSFVKSRSVNEDEHYARRRLLMDSPDSDEIPPPVRSKIAVNISNIPETISQRKNRKKFSIKSPINIDSMAQDYPNQIRNFADGQQQTEIEQRFYSLENSRSNKFKTNDDLYGTEQNVQVHLGLSPIPPYSSPIPFWPPGLISPACYYYYYVANGLSNSYHDLSQLQQKNMLSIMQRSGFLPNDSQDQQTQTDQHSPSRPKSTTLQDVTSKVHSKQTIQSFDGAEISENPDLSNVSDSNTRVLEEDERTSMFQRLEPETATLERSFSMPSIRTDPSIANEDHRTLLVSNTGMTDSKMISDEIVEELEFWEQQIQDEKKHQSIESSLEQEISSEKKDSNSSLDRNPIPIRDSTVIPQSIPAVNVQPSTPNLSINGLQSDSNQSEHVESTKKELEREEEQQESLAINLAKSENDSKIGKNTGTEQKSSNISHSSRIPSVSKSGQINLPPRRMSKSPQQLYIKTTPAIPMNANIQHILGNVARTEGPFKNPNEAVKAAMIALRDNAWTTKVEGMLAVVRLATFHPHHLIKDQHQIALALASETRNLRSTVARSSIFTIGELFAKLKSQIEPELEILTQALMHKISENSPFIRDDVDQALQSLVTYMPQTRAALSLINFGSNHRNGHVRRSCSQFLSKLVDKMGSMKCLLGPRDIGEQLMPAAARFLQDPSPHTRYFARRIFSVLMQHPLFDKFLRKHVSPGTYRNICGMLETIKRRGVGDAPPDLYSPSVQPKHSDPRRLIVVGDVFEA